MRNLFLKIFLSVLLTVLLTAIVSLVIAIWTMPGPPMFPPPGRPGREPRTGAQPPNMMAVWRERLSDVLALHAQSLEAEIQEHGMEAALEPIDDLAARWGIRIYLVDVAGTDIRHRVLSTSTTDLAREARDKRKLTTGGGDQRVVVAVPLEGAGGRPWVLVGETPEQPRPPALFFAWGMLMRLGPFVLTLGLVCYFLARYITSPLSQLRAALRRFARGDLDQRVAPAIGARRDEIGEVARDFDHMAERIAMLLTTQRRLLQDISHELRSPLARQRVALELVREKDGPSAERALDRAELEAQRLEGLIGELLSLTRLESDTERAERRPVDLAAVIHEVIENAEFEACNTMRSIHLTACVPCSVSGVPELVRRAIENIVRNALAYTADGTAVEVSLQQEAKEAIIRVRDRGPGVPEAELTDIFRPFYRVSRARDRQTGGTGLGLAIAARAVDSHNGCVTAANHPGGGLVVEIRLPRDMHGP